MLVLLSSLKKIENYFLYCTVTHSLTPFKDKMNNRESSNKAIKNQFREIITQRIISSRVPKEKRVISPEKAAEKEAGYVRWQAKKAEKKRLRSKHRLAK